MATNNELIETALRAHCEAFKVHKEAVDDVLLHVKDFFVEQGEVKCLSGIDIATWFQEAKDGTGTLSRPHWFPGAADDIVPFTREGFNKTKQAEVVRRIGAEAATELARKAGLSGLGDTKPAEAATAQRSKNCFHADSWNVTSQGRLLAALQKAHGADEGYKRCAAIAASVNSRIGATAPSTKPTEGVGPASVVRPPAVDAANPFIGKVNLTAVSKLIRDRGMVEAEKLASAAGTSVAAALRPGPQKVGYLSSSE